MALFGKKNKNEKIPPVAEVAVILKTWQRLKKQSRGRKC